MTDLAVITPCFRGDAELFEYLHRSVLEFTSADTVHHVLVPLRDVGMFRQYEGPRCRVWIRSEILPPRYLRIPFSDVYVNVFNPYPPLRGWVMQQTAKIAATAASEADAVVIIDSDAVLVRPINADRFRTVMSADSAEKSTSSVMSADSAEKSTSSVMSADSAEKSTSSGGRLNLYRIENGVRADMTRHVIWHQVSRRLLGLPDAPPPPLPDYVTPMSVWDPAIARAMLARVAEVTGKSWMDAFNGERHISEFMLYGVFLEEFLTPTDRPAADDSIVYNYYSRVPLDHDSAATFVDSLPDRAVAMMISAKSGTSDEIRRFAMARSAEVVKAQ
jgi:hypothetical protein